MKPNINFCIYERKCKYTLGKSICFLIPYNNQNATKPFKKLKSFWEKLGANTIVISAEEHDFIAAGVSHLPHIVAVALVNSLSNVKWQGKDITNFAGQGWKDTTRIAKGLPEIWIDIFSSNTDELLLFIEKFDKQWNGIKKSLQGENFKKLREILEQASRIFSSH